MLSGSPEGIPQMILWDIIDIIQKEELQLVAKLQNSASSFHLMLSSSIFNVCRCSSFVPHRWHLLSSLLYDVSDHTNHIFSVRIWSWQHVSVNISSIAELSPVYCCLVIHDQHIQTFEYICHTLFQIQNKYTDSLPPNTHPIPPCPPRPANPQNSFGHGMVSCHVLESESELWQKTL